MYRGKSQLLTGKGLKWKFSVFLEVPVNKSHKISIPSAYTNHRFVGAGYEH